MDSGEEISGGFVVARDDGAELFEFAEDVLDQVARLLEVAVEIAARATVFAQRDHDGFSSARQRPDDRASASKALSAISGSAAICGNRASVPTRSWVCPGVRKKISGLPRASTSAWIFALSPPLLWRPIARSSSFLGAAGAVLVRRRDAADLTGFARTKITAFSVDHAPSRAYPRRSFLMLAGVSEAAGAAQPAVPMHEIPLPSFEPPKIVGQPIHHAVAAAPVPPLNLGEVGWVERLWTDPIATFSMAVALFSLALATFSYFQLRPLRHTVSATINSAAALPALERAYVFLTVEGTTIEPLLLEARGNIGAEMAPMTIDGLSVHYRYENHGNTPAVIRAASVEFAHLPVLPSDLRYSDTPVDGEIVIRGGEANPRDKAETRYLTTPLTQEDVIKLSNGESFLWLYGHILNDDIFGEGHETAFCWYYDGLAKSFYPYGGRRYNYRT